MSVINDMLRDLDKRQAPEVGGSQSAPKESIVAPQNSAKPKLVILLVLVFVLLVAGYFMMAGIGSSSSENVTTSERVEESATVVKAKPTLESMFQVPPESEPEVSPKLSQAVSETSVTHANTEAKTPTETPPVLTVLGESQSVKSQPATDPVLDFNASQKPHATSTSDTIPDAASVKAEKKVTETKPVAKKVLSQVLAQPQEPAPELSRKIIPAESAPVVVKLSPSALDQQTAEQAKNLIAKGNAGEAYRQLYDFIGREGVDTQSRIVLATYLLQEGRLAEAGDVLVNASLVNSPQLRQLKARWYAEQGEHKLAIYTLNSDLPSVALHPDYYVLLAAYYQRYGSPQEAQETYAALVEYDETVADWWAGLGLASDRNNQREKAIFAYRQALDLKGLSPELLNFVQPRLKTLQASFNN